MQYQASACVISLNLATNDLMTIITRIYTLTVLLLLYPFAVRPQNAPIGSWESHLPYNSAIGLAAEGNTLYTICNYGFFSLNTAHENAYTPYSKTDGMSDITMQRVAYDVATGTLILAYSNGNIDLYKDNTFYNIPDLKLNITGESKAIYQVYASDGIAYLATHLGIIVIDLAKHRIENTMEIIRSRQRGITAVNEILAITGFIVAGDYFYAATDYGVYRVNKNNPRLPDPTVWTKTDSTHSIVHISMFNNELIFASSKSVYKISGDTLLPVYNTNAVFKTNIRHIDAGNDNLMISEYSDSNVAGAVKIMKTDLTITDSLTCYGKPQQALQMPDNTFWIADSVNGLQKFTGNGNKSYYFPDGPSNPYSFDIYAHNKELYIAHGGYNQILGGNFSQFGVSYLHNDKWKLYKHPYFPELENAKDILTVTKDESTGNVYAASFLNGLVTIKPGDKIEQLGSAVFDPGHTYYGDQFRQVIGLALDKPGNLWLTLVNSDHLLYAKTTDDNWHKFVVPDVTFGGPMLVDDNGQIWFVSILTPSELSGGIVVYNPKGTTGDATDDASYHLRVGKGSGNLPNNNVFCIAKDKNNDIWVGTLSGICIVKGCNAPATQSPPCDAIIPMTPSGPLFAKKAVYSIAVDEANRKWVGTDEGVWLLSPDGLTVIEKFTEENSPLPSNRVQKVAIDKVTGDVYIGTYYGLVSYHSTLTEAATSNDEAVIFPNPVPAGYKGSIAIRGLLTNSDVRITDVSGQLVYQAHLQAGGQIIWNGNDYTGHRAQSGVYLVFISGSDGKQTNTGKIVFLQ